MLDRKDYLRSLVIAASLILVVSSCTSPSTDTTATAPSDVTHGENKSEPANAKLVKESTHDKTEDKTITDPVVVKHATHQEVESKPISATETDKKPADQSGSKEISETDLVEAIVRAQLLVPRSAEFAPVGEWKIAPVRIGTTLAKEYKMYTSPKKTESNSKIETSYQGWVESQNEFGTQVRNHFVVRLRTGNIEDGYLERMAHLASSNIYDKGIKVPPGKIHVRYVELNGDERIGPSNRIFYDRATGELEKGY